LSQVRTLRWKLVNWRAAVEYALGIRPQRVLFNHMPKCAGTSVNRYLFAQYPHHRIFHLDTSNAHRSIAEFSALSESDRYRYRLISGHYAHSLLPLVHPETICFTIFRDPVDRLVSLYYFIQQSPMHYLYEKVAATGMSLEQFAGSRLSPELNNWYTSHLTGRSAEEIAAAPNVALEHALRALDRYAVVGFFDDIPDSLHRLRAIAGYRRRYHDQQVNRTRSRRAVTEVSESAIECIRSQNAVDLDLYLKLREARPAKVGRS
jgi:hypothetical protein